MLRVAHMLNAPSRGGVPRVVHALVSHTDRAKFAPHVFYLKAGLAPDPFEKMGIPCRVAQNGSKAAAMTELLAFLEHHGIDILHTHSFRPNLYGRMAAAVLRPAGLKIVAHYHNDYSDKWIGDIAVLERQLKHVTDAGLAVSKSVADHVCARVGLTCELAENGIDRPRVTGGNRADGRAFLKIADDDFTVGLIGRICEQKGIDTFVEAGRQCLPDLPHARFIIIGEAENPALSGQLNERVNLAGLGGRILFAGHHEEMAKIYAALDLVAAPSRWEGFGLMLAEAMAAGVPVLASDVGGIPDVVGTAGLLVAPNDPDDLASAITSLFHNPDRRSEMIAAGLTQSARFDWSRTAGKVEAVYHRIGGRD